MFVMENAHLEWHACGYRYRNPINWGILPVYLNILISRITKMGRQDIFN